MFSQPALVHGAKGGSGPAHGACGDGPVNAAVQQDQVLFSSSAAQCCHLQEQQSNAELQFRVRHIFISSYFQRFEIILALFLFIFPGEKQVHFHNVLKVLLYFLILYLIY